MHQDSGLNRLATIFPPKSLKKLSQICTYKEIVRKQPGARQNVGFLDRKTIAPFHHVTLWSPRMFRKWRLPNFKRQILVGTAKTLGTLDHWANTPGVCKKHWPGKKFLLATTPSRLGVPVGRQHTADWREPAVSKCKLPNRLKTTKLRTCSAPNKAAPGKCLGQDWSRSTTEISWRVKGGFDKFIVWSRIEFCHMFQREAIPVL